MTSLRRLRPERVDADPADGRSDPVRSAAWIAIAICGVISLITLGGWAAGADGVVRLAPGLPSMKANAALALLGIVVATRVRGPAVWLPLTLAGLISLGTIGEYATSSGSVIDQFLVTDPQTVRLPGRMAALTALTIALLAAAVALSRVGRVRAGRRCAFVATVVGALLTLGWAYDLPSVSASRPLWAVSPQTAIAELLLSLGVLVGVTGALDGWARADDPGAVLMRRLLPAALLGLPLLGLLALLGEHVVGYGANATAALTVTSSALLVGGVAVVAGRRVTRSATTTRRALAELTELRDDLEHQVAERAELLHHRSRAIAVLQDRQRIAADLHDIVIQRLFAAGMMLQSAPTTDPVMRDRVDTTVQAMDAVIDDLRTSIFELKSFDARSALTDSLAAVCHESEAILGFAPQLIVDDPDGASHYLADDLLAVVREALANVARHAGAGAVTVLLRAQNGAVTLTVTDDGRGMSDSGRSSGTGNVRARAREHGGDCTWTNVLPTGTELRWRVPIRSSVLA